MPQKNKFQQKNFQTAFANLWAEQNAEAWVNFWNKLSKNPEVVFKNSWEILKLFEELHKYAQERFFQQDPKPIFNTKDRRFKHQDWQEKIYLDVIKQSYLGLSAKIKEIITNLPWEDQSTKEQVSFFLNQYLEMLSPANFPLLNPEIMENSHSNISQGFLKLWQEFTGAKNTFNKPNYNKFFLGINIAPTPYKVIWENELCRLLEFTPKTQKFAEPILIVPPYFKDYYIFDLTAEDSFIEWLLSKGHKIFVLAWKNPNVELKDYGFSNYIEKGLIASVKYLRQRIKNKKIHAIGYCLGGMVLLVGLAWAKKLNKEFFASTSFLTTLVDFSSVGDLKILLTPEILKLNQKLTAELGFLPGENINGFFNLLRANDMIWNNLIDNYFLGKELDNALLHWNNETFNLTAKSCQDILEGCYTDNSLFQGKMFPQLNLNSKVPTFVLSTREDHIAPWKSTFKILNFFEQKEFVLAGGGHLAGVINHPNKNKNQYWVNQKNELDPELWFKNTQNYKGSWWNYWHQWYEKNFAKV